MSEKSIENLTTSTGIRLYNTDAHWCTSLWPSHTTPPNVGCSSSSSTAHTGVHHWVMWPSHTTPPNVAIRAASTQQVLEFGCIVLHTLVYITVMSLVYITGGDVAITHDTRAASTQQAQVRARHMCHTGRLGDDQHQLCA